jgi:1-acyl-sn-glycerol-3-phosphate acyltransferase
MDLFFRCASSSLYLCFRLFYECKIYGTKTPYSGAAIIAPNHASFLDPPLIGAFWPEETHFLAKASLFEKWYMNWLLVKLHSHPVRGTAQDVQSMRMICQLLKEGKKVVIFPEGIRTEDGKLQPVKSGISMLALRMGCPIIPVYIHGTYEAWPKHSRWPRGGSTIACIFGNPIFATNVKGLNKKAAQETMACEVQAAIEKLKSWFENGAQGEIP